MKKSQRARLAELTAKAEASRTIEEKAEFASLSTLATHYADASKDVDDVSPAAAADAKPAATATASPAAGAAAPPTPAPAPAAAAQPVPPPAGTLASFVRGAVESIRGRAAVGSDLVTARQTIATLTTERDTARTDLTAANTRIAEQAAQLDVFAACFGLKPEALKGKTAADLSALMNQAIANLATEQVASLGFPANQLPKPDAKASDGPAELLRQYNEITDPVAKAEFYAKNKAAMFTGAN